MTDFARIVEQFAERAKADIDAIVRGVAIEALTRMVLRSPVGNPELWAANAEVMARRAQYNANVRATNSLIDAHPELFSKGGVHGKVKKQRELSARTIANRLPLQAGKGYVGGRFRANWIISIGKPASRTLDEAVIDPSGGNTIGAGIEALTGYKAGPPVYITNSLPYAQRLEFGHSKQAPQGMVRLTVAELQSVVDDQVTRIRSTSK